MILIEDYQKVS